MDEEMTLLDIEKYKYLKQEIDYIKSKQKPKVVVSVKLEESKQNILKELAGLCGTPVADLLRRYIKEGMDNDINRIRTEIANEKM